MTFFHCRATAVILLSALIIVVAGGCPQTSPTSPPVRSGGWGSDSPTIDQTAAEDGTSSAVNEGNTTSSSQKPAAEQPVEETVRVAAPGVTGKGDYSTAPAVMQPITVPVSAYFATRERMVFNIQIPEALKLFEAEHGTKPSSHEEFMEKIIHYNQIKLPQLKNDTDRYQYDPTDGQLKVLSRK